MRPGPAGAIGPIERFAGPGKTFSPVFGKSRWNWPRSPSASPRRTAREGRVRLEQVAVRVDVDHLAERRVRGRAVVALEEVLDHDLPVRVRAELDARVELDRSMSMSRARIAGRSPRCSASGAAGSGLTNRNGPQVSTLGRQERPVVVVEAGLAIRARRGCAASRRGRRSTRGSGTGACCGAAAVHQDRAAMAADVDERAQIAFPVAGDEDRHAACVGRKVRAGLCDLAARPPYCQERAKITRALAAERLLVAVPGERKRERGHVPMLDG